MKNLFQKIYVTLLVAMCLSAVAMQSIAQQVGDNVVMSSANAAGVPVHPADGDNSYVRWPNVTTGKVMAIGAQSQWRRVESNGQSGWITVGYLTVQPASDTDPEEPGNELQSYVVGAWNLEWFSNTASRGFPEKNQGGPSYGPRTDADYVTIAQTIRDRINAKILVLSEIRGATATRSDELDRLLQKLGGRWGYYLAPSSNPQRLAVLFDSSAVNCTRCIEIAVAEREIQSADIFDRDPLVCSFTFLDHTGTPRNDLLVVAVHLASGQGLNVNHDTAMAVLSRKLSAVTSDGTFSSSEKDVLIAGDFNASRYDNKTEIFWDNTSPTSFKFKTWSPADGDDYPGTRLAGVPLLPTSKIDYIMISGRTGGLTDEIVEPSARVRIDLLPADFDLWREHQSDHIPVTVQIRIVADND
jgi:endonuclease/exonuclease/phosphatase family metal-dependent hydrolase